jgi:hypothetical protein
MGITISTVRVGQKLTKEQLKQVRKIAKKPIHYTRRLSAFHAGSAGGIRGSGSVTT